LKQRLVEEIGGGRLSMREAARDAHTTVAMVQVWLREYGRFQPKRNIVEVVMKAEQDRIAALKKALAEAHLRLQVYDELITQANKRYKTDLKKAFGPSPRPPSAVGATGHPSAPSVAPSASPGMPTTSGGADAAPQLRRTR